MRTSKPSVLTILKLSLLIHINLLIILSMFSSSRLMIYFGTKHLEFIVKVSLIMN